MEKLKQVKGVIFDLDGTLLDSMNVWRDIDIAFLAKRGIPLPNDYIETINAMEFIQAAKYTIDRFHLQETPESLMKEWNEMAKYAYKHNVKIKPMVKEYIVKLREHNIKIGIATSAIEDVCIPALQNNDIYKFIFAMTTTTEVQKGKEYPDVYLKTVQKLGLEVSQCAVFEDTLQGIKTANLAGFITVGIYDVDARNQQEEIRQEADMYITSFHELL